MPNPETPVSSRETFDKNEENILQTKQELAEAVTAGNYDRVTALAQEAKNLEATRNEMKDIAHDEADAEEKTRKEAELAAEAKLQAEKAAQEAARVSKELEIAQKKQAIAEAVAAGEYDKVATLAQEAKDMEMAKNEMTGASAETDAKEQREGEAKLVEQARADAQKAAELLGKLKNSNTESPAPEIKKEVSENEPIDAIALNNKLVRMPGDYRSEEEKKKILANLSPQEISAVAKMIGEEENFRWRFDTLKNFDNKLEIILQPEVIEAFRKDLEKGMHVYDLERLISLHSVPEELFNEPAVRENVRRSVKEFVSRQSESDWPFVIDSLDQVAKGMHLSGQELRSIAEELKGNRDAFSRFTKHFGIEQL